MYSRSLNDHSQIHSPILTTMIESLGYSQLDPILAKGMGQADNLVVLLLLEVTKPWSRCILHAFKLLHVKYRWPLGIPRPAFLAQQSLSYPCNFPSFRLLLFLLLSLSLFLSLYFILSLSVSKEQRSWNYDLLVSQKKKKRK